jgi:predicted heme/steroid binding protein
MGCGGSVAANVSGGDIKSNGVVIKKASEVAKHNSAKSCWIIIKGLIYDVTPFLKQHPGGAQMILLYAGKDATQAFNGVHTHTSYAKGLLDQYHIGYLPEAAPKPGAAPAPAPAVYKAGPSVPDTSFQWKFELGKVDKLTVDTSLFHFTATAANGANKFSLTPGQHIYVK